MAKLHKKSDPNLVELYGGPSGRKLIRAVRKSGQIIAGGSIIGHVKVDLTVADVERMWSKREGAVHVTLAGREFSGPIISPEKQAARDAAAKRRAAENQALDDAETAKLAEGIAPAAEWCLQIGRSARDSRVRYVTLLAKFHGGANVNLDGPMLASMLVRDADERKKLDAIADEVARKVYGSDMRGAERWARAMGVL